MMLPKFDLKPEFVLPERLSENDINVLIGIGRRQSRLVDLLQCALEDGDKQAAIEIARLIAALEK
jgi:hypothetical protein